MSLPSCRIAAIGCRSLLSCQRTAAPGRAWIAPGSRLDRAGIPYRIIGAGPQEYLRPAFRLIRLLRAQKPDLLWTSLTRATVYGQLAGALLGIPVVSWQHNAFLKPADRRLLRLTKKLTLRWVADSEAVTRFAVRELGLKREDIDIWPLFMTGPEVSPAPRWDGAGRFRIGSLGRLHRNKGYDLLIEAVALFRDRNPELRARAEFVIAGVGPEKETLAALAATRGVENFEFAGYREDAQDFLAGLHAYIQPSRNEGLCIAAHEAMQAGLPVVTTPVGEMQHSNVDGETGFLCPVGDAAKLAEAIENLVRNPDRAARMGAAAGRRVNERFSGRRFEENGRAALRVVERARLARRTGKSI